MLKMWTEDYRPSSEAEYVFRDERMRAKVDQWVKQGGPENHLLFHGPPGTGKTSLALLLLKLLNVPSADILVIPANKERKIEVVEEKIKSFCQVWAMGSIKYVILDEADSLSMTAQKFLRGEMQDYAEDTRFILTCNYLAKILPAIRSRCSEYGFEALDVESFVACASRILDLENITYDMDTVCDYVSDTYPDLRKCIGLIQDNCLDGRLHTKPDDVQDTKDYIVDMVDLFRSGKFLEARKLVVSQAQEEEYPDIYRFMYQNLDIWGDGQDEQDEALLVIRRGLLNHSMIAIAELNLAATFVELSRIRKRTNV